MVILLRLLGTLLVLIAIIDVFLTVLHPRSESYLLSIPIARVLWRLFRSLAPGPMKRRDRILSYGGPIIMVALIGVWVLLMLLGFTLIIWPGLGTGIQAEQGETPRDFFTALYYTGFSIGTLGTGDLAPQDSGYRMLMVFKSLLGFSVFTLVLSYVLSVYGALTNRNTFALSLHHRTANTANTAELLARIGAGNDTQNLNYDLSAMAQRLVQLLELNNSYPLLLYFRYRQTYYALPRVAYLVIDTATLIKSALDVDHYSSVSKAASTTELWCGGLHLLEELSHSVGDRRRTSSPAAHTEWWREHYYQSLQTLQAQGIKTTANPAAGADAYCAMRQTWAPYIDHLIGYMGYHPSHIYH